MKKTTTIELLAAACFIFVMTKYSFVPGSDKRLVTLLIMTAVCGGVLVYQDRLGDVKRVSGPGKGKGDTSEGKGLVTGALDLRELLRDRIASLQRKRIYEHSPGKFIDAVKKLDVFFIATDKGIMRKKSSTYLRQEIQGLRDMRADALNSLHSLHFSITNPKLRRKLYKVAQMSRLESLRALSSVVAKHQDPTVNLFELDLSAPLSYNQVSGSMSQVFI